MAEYNIEADIDGYTTPRPGLYAVLEAIGENYVNGAAHPFDILTLEETTSNSATVAPIVSALNIYYGGTPYAQSGVQGTESGNDPSEGNGPNAVVYNTTDPHAAGFGRDRHAHGFDQRRVSAGDAL